MSGFIALYREAFEHPLLKDAERFRAWFWLVAHVAWKPTRFDVAGRMITLERGQICASVRQLADTWGWSKSSVDRFLTRLKEEGMITTDAGTGKLIVTVCNYSKYQDVEERTGTDFEDQQHPNATRTKTDQKPGHLEQPSNPQKTADFFQAEAQQRDTSGTAAGHERDIKEQGNKGTIEEEEPNGPSSSARAGDDTAGELPLGGPPQLPAKPPRNVSEETPLPEEFTPVLGKKRAAMVAGWPPGMFDHQLERFRVHAIRNKRLAKDWNAAFGTWADRADKGIKGYADRGEDFGAGASRAFPERDHRDGFQRALDRELQLGSAQEPSRSAGRWDDGPPAGHPRLSRAAR